MSEPVKKHVWCLKVYIHATEVEARDVAERLGAAICPDPAHPGYCDVPWAIETSRPTGKAATDWRDYFADERAAAERAHSKHS